MRSDILKGFLPWFIFFAFNDGSPAGLVSAALAGLICLVIFNRQGLKKHFILDVSSFILLAFFIIGGFIFYHAGFSKYSLLITDAFLAVVCLGSLLTPHPFALQYAKVKVSEHYWRNPVFLGINYWLSFIWGFMFLFAAISVALFLLGFGSKLWLLEIIPTALIVSALFFTVLFPDSFQRKFIKKKGGVAAIPHISEIQTIPLGSMQIACRTVGEGPLLVLIYGARMNMHSWDVDFLKRLSQSFKLLIFDLPGVSYSSYEGNMPYSVESLANVLHRLLEKLALKPAGIVGYSMGGWIAQEFAVHYPDEAPLLILMSSCIGGEKMVRCSVDTREKLQALRSLVGDELNEEKMKLDFPEQIIPRIKEKMLRVYETTFLEGAPSAEIMEQIIQLVQRWYQGNDQPDKLKELTMPSLILAGKEDLIVPPENSQVLHALLKHSEVVEYPDAGHGLFYQYPLDVADQIKEFLVAHRGRE